MKLVMEQDWRIGIKLEFLKYNEIIIDLELLKTISGNDTSYLICQNCENPVK